MLSTIRATHYWSYARAWIRSGFLSGRSSDGQFKWRFLEPVIY